MIETMKSPIKSLPNFILSSRCLLIFTVWWDFWEGRNDVLEGSALVEVCNVVVCCGIDCNLHTPSHTADKKEVGRVVLQDEVVERLRDWVAELASLGLWNEDQRLDISLGGGWASPTSCSLAECLARRSLCASLTKKVSVHGLKKNYNS